MAFLHLFLLTNFQIKNSFLIPCYYLGQGYKYKQHCHSDVKNCYQVNFSL